MCEGESDCSFLFFLWAQVLFRFQGSIPFWTVYTRGLTGAAQVFDSFMMGATGVNQVRRRDLAGSSW